MPFENKLILQNAEVILHEAFFSKEESKEIFEKLVSEIAWKQDKIKMYGKVLDLPRLTAWYGEEGKTYRYSGIDMQIHAWNEVLLFIKNRIEKVANVHFNGVLLNFYRNGNDSMAWHSDNEKELGKNPVIASVSFGETRKFRLRHKTNKTLKTEVLLTDGSLLLMQGETQHFWQHEIPKTKRQIGERINLTFRYIL